MALEGGALAGAIIGGLLGSLLLLCIILWSFWVRGSRVQTKRRLDGSTVVITGANTGIGKATALELCKRGARVVMLCRNMEKAEKAAEEIRSQGGKGGEVIVHKLDLSSFASVRSCAEQLNNSLEKIDILINNAGLCCPTSKTEDGFEIQFATNHLGPFLLTNLLLPLLKRGVPDARIVNVSSEAYKWHHIQWDDLMFENTPYNQFKAYAQSKLANILFTKELARKGEGSGVTAYAVHPGVVATEIQRHNENNHNCCTTKLFHGMKALMKSPDTGAQTTLYCALEETLADKSGGYYMGCKEVTPSAAARNMEDADRLWKLSEELTQLHNV